MHRQASIELGTGDTEMKVTIPDLRECRVSPGRQLHVAGSNTMCSVLSQGLKRLETILRIGWSAIKVAQNA